MKKMFPSIAAIAAGSSEVLQLRLKYNEPFFVRTIPLMVFGASFTLIIVLIALLIYMWEQSRYVTCPECRTRNLKANMVCTNCGARLRNPPLTEQQKKWFGAFGWTKNPFILNADPAMHIGRKAEILLIIEKLNTLSGHILVIGGIGSGKTVLLHWLENHLKDKYVPIFVQTPPEDPDKLINMVLEAIGKRPFRDGEKADVYKFHEMCKNSRKKILIMLDSAQESQGLFKRFLSTLANVPNVSLIIAGHSEVREMIRHDMPDLFDRIVETIFLGALSLSETKELIMKRIHDAGGKGTEPFNAQALEEIQAVSFGIPLKVLKICDWAVANAVRDSKIMIDSPDIRAYLPVKQQGG